jgi:hypothetical protein
MVDYIMVARNDVFRWVIVVRRMDTITFHVFIKYSSTLKSDNAFLYLKMLDAMVLM